MVLPAYYNDFMMTTHIVYFPREHYKLNPDSIQKTYFPPIHFIGNYTEK